MSEKRIIATNNAPQAIGPYSQAVVYNGVVYCSGQIPIDPETGELLEGSIQDKTHRVIKNLEAVLEEAGSSLTKVIKCSIFLASMDDFAAVNEVYGTYFSTEPPARETVAVKTLPKSCDIEISCIAHI